jgi:endonuclease III
MAHKTISAEDLDIDVASGRERELFKWFLASFLFGKRIQQQVARQAYEVLVDKHHLDSPAKICKKSWQQLVDLLGEGHYVRYDESTAERLQALCHKLQEDYGGKLSRLRKQSTSVAEAKRRLREFKGVGPKTIEIFMREARKVWA